MQAFFLVNSSFGQDIKPFLPEGEATYFNFWEVTWYVLNDDNSIDSNSYFVVEKSAHPSCFLEEWHYKGGFNIALRTWDKTNNKWGFVWASANGLYQVWDTRKVGNDWYIYKQFTIEGDTYLSRQSFILQADGTVLRTSEKSYDEKNGNCDLNRGLRR